MKFSEFAQLLFPIIGAGNSTSAFIRTLFDTIVDDNGKATIESLKDPTFKAYYNGNNDISKIARKITAYIEPMEFEEYINNFPDSTVQLLCDSFELYISGINLHNASSKIAELFTSIIKDAAKTNKKITPKSDCEKNNSASEESAADSCSNVDDNFYNNSKNEKLDYIDAEVEDDNEPSGAAEEKSQESSRIQIINNPTIVNQYGEKIYNIQHVEHLD